MTRQHRGFQWPEVILDRVEDLSCRRPQTRRSSDFLSCHIVSQPFPARAVTVKQLSPLWR